MSERRERGAMWRVALSGLGRCGLSVALTVGLLSALAAPAWAQEDELASPMEEAVEESGGAAAAGLPAATAPKAEETLAPTLSVDATDAERAALEAYQRAFSRYQQESEDYQRTVDGIVESKYRQKVAEVQAAYNRTIDEKTAIERSQRVEAIAAFEAFLARYPRHPRYAPDALFRLAELYFEKANDDYLLDDESYQTELVLYEQGKRPEEPDEPTRDYGPTIRTFRRLLNDWPDYRLLDGAYYLLAYCELQQNNDDIAKDLFVELIAKRPESDFVPEAWIRIGEYHFERSQLDEARAAYAKAMEKRDGRFFDKALYKLAWTHYRQDQFDAAIKRFKELIEYSDEMELRTGQSGSVLRLEAVQYAAISLSESDWDLDGVVDNDFGLTRAKRYLEGTKPYEREILVALTEYMFEKSFFGEAADVARYGLAQYPLHPENPQFHEQLVLALFRNEDMNGAFEERRRMGEFYGPDSAWYEAQRAAGNVEAMAYASDLAKDNLIQSATWFHEQAQKERDEALARQNQVMLASSREKYALAAKTYAEFLRKHPNDKDAYQWNFYYAETLFYSEQYLLAYEQYRSVREMDLRSKDFYELQEVSALNSVKALEIVLGEKVQKGELPAKVISQGAAQEVPPEGVAITAEPLPELALRYVTEMDRYVVLRFKNSQDPFLDSKLAFQAAKMYYDFNDFPEARRRFEWIIRNYPDKEVGAFAASLTLETYRLEKDYETLAAKASEFAGMLKGDQVTAIRAEIEDYELASIFKAAEKAYAEGNYEEAAARYLELMSRDKEKRYVTLALINTAVAYEKLERPGEAAKLYERLYTEYPKDDYAPYALYRVAVTSERFFEFEKASQNYLAFYDRFATKPTPEKVEKGLGFSYADRGAQALLNGAILLESLQDYRKASARYVEYATKYATRKEAADAYWQAIQCWKKAGQTKEMLAGYERFVDRYGSTERSLKVFEALGALYDYHAERKNDKEAKKWYKRTIDEYVRYGIQPGAPEAFYAAKAEFMMIEYDFAEWDKIKLKGNVKAQGELLQKKVKGQQELNKRYDKVYSYLSLDWTLATSFKVGQMYQRFAQMLYDAPVPFREGSEEWDMYRSQLDDIAVPLEDKAVENYEQLIKKAREEKVVNEWTKRALDELNKYRPADFPLYKEERRTMADQAVTGLPFLDATTYEQLLNPPKQTEE